MSLNDLSYRRILVIGGVKVGKTSILASAINGGFISEYHATTHTERYYDCTRQLEFIDTPGLNDDKLNGLHALQTNYSGLQETEKTTAAQWTQIKFNYGSFREDIQIRDLLNDPIDRSISRISPVMDIDLSTIDAFMIVYTDDDRSKRMAKALRHAILSKGSKHANQKYIYFLHNTGDLDRRALSGMLHTTEDMIHFQEEKNDAAIGLIYRDDLPITSGFYKGDKIHFLPTVSAQTGYLITQTLDRLARDLHHHRKRHITLHSTKTIKRNGCTIPNVVNTVCCIQ